MIVPLAFCRHGRVLLALALVAPAASPALAAEHGSPAAGLSDPAVQGSTRTLYLSLIRQARVDGRARAALAYLDDFDRQYPRDRDALMLRVNCLLDLGQTDAAEAALKRIAQNPQDGGVLEVRGHVAAAQGRWQQAATDYAEALVQSPANPLIGNALGYARLRSGQPELAVEALKAAYDLAPREAVIRNNLVLALTVAGRGGEADTVLGSVRDPAARARIRREVAAQAPSLAAPVPAVPGPVLGPVPAPAPAPAETGGQHG
ncbi:tetratricopeptide repeat protein [Sphingomonas sp. IC081]|uniref:tetratricopeptide repeat protein n=1 Tax=Sphingomonas sp. IC081 TaxID=304378 RepID=UPI001157D9E9|nr:tetratricopeptide repeat protein [Sphingomonas sp. IC081]QDK35424.1 pilus assembly protein TadD [Sphingomonas sp. IC081]